MRLMIEHEPLPVKVSNERIKQAYESISPLYGIIEPLGKKIRKKGLAFLHPQQGEHILEIGFGTGSTLVKIAEAVGKEGKAIGIDVAKNMVRFAKKRLTKKGLLDRTVVIQGDARSIPSEEGRFDAVYMAEVLELFPTAEIPEVLAECKRVLKSDGRLIVIAMAREGYEHTLFVRVYEWLHQLFPKYLNCRPIYLEASISDAGFEILQAIGTKVAGVTPLKMVVARPKT